MKPLPCSRGLRGLLPREGLKLGPDRVLISSTAPKQCAHAGQRAGAPSPFATECIPQADNTVWPGVVRSRRDRTTN
jgi:hypothetical protein